MQEISVYHHIKINGLITRKKNAPENKYLAKPQAQFFLTWLMPYDRPLPASATLVSTSL